MNTIKQWPVFFLLLAFAISPLFFMKENNILVCIQILVLTVFIKGLLSSYQEFRIPFNSLTFSICLFYIWMALSISWSPSPVISLHSFVGLSIFPLCFFTYSIKQPGDIAYLQLGILCITLIFAFIGIGQVFGFLYSDSPAYIRSLFPTNNSFAALLNIIALSVTAYFILEEKMNTRSSKLLGIILFILFFTMFLTGGRGAMISLLLGLVFISVISWKHTDKSSLIKIIIIVTLAFLLSNIQNDNIVVSELTELSAGISTPSIMQRTLSWQSALQIIKTNPVIGTGIGTYYIVSPPFKHVDDQDPGYFAHNEYIQFWLETGIIGLSLMVIIMIAIFRLFLCSLKHTDLKLQDRLEITGLMAGLFSIALQSFFEFHFHIISFLIIMGFMCARVQEIFHLYNSKLMRSYIPAQKLSRKPFMLATSIIPIFMLNYSAPTVIADHYLNKAKKQIVAGEFENGDLTLMLAAKWNPNSIPIYYQQYSLYRRTLNIIGRTDSISERKTLYIKTLSILKIIEEINPLTGIVSEGRGHLLVENSDIRPDGWEKQAINEFKNALKLNPILFRARLALARLLVQQGDSNEAFSLMNDGVNYFYQRGLPGLGEFYQYANKLNLMNDDTIKAREVQIEKDLLLDKQ